MSKSDNWLRQDRDSDIGLEQAGINDDFVDRAANGLVQHSADQQSLNTNIARLQAELQRRLRLAWQISHGEITPNNHHRYMDSENTSWTDLAALVAITVLKAARHDQLYVDADKPSHSVFVPPLRIVETLLASAMGSATAAISDVSNDEPLPWPSRLGDALAVLAQAAAADMAHGDRAEAYETGLAAIRCLVSALEHSDDPEAHLIGHVTLAALYFALPESAEGGDLWSLVHRLQDFSHLPSHGGSIRQDGATLDPVLPQIPTVRNLLARLAVGTELVSTSHESVTTALDRIEDECGKCLHERGCGEEKSACATRGEDSPYCQWLIGIYLDCLRHLWEVVRSPEPLDHAISIGQTRRLPDDPTAANRLLVMRCTRFTAYRRHDDREYLRAILTRDDYIGLPSWVMDWLLQDIPAPDRSGVVPTFLALGLEAAAVLTSILTTLDHPSSMSGLPNRIRRWKTLAEKSVELGFSDVSLAALDAHAAGCGLLHAVAEDNHALVAVAVAARREVTALRAALMASAGRLDEAVALIESSRFGDMRDNLSFAGFRLGDSETDLSLASDETVLSELHQQLNALREPNIEEDRLTQIVKLRWRIEEVHRRIAIRTTMPTSNDLTLHMVQQRSAQAGCPIVYLWSTDQRGHLLVVEAAADARHVELSTDLSTWKIEFLITGLRTSMLGHGELSGEVERVLLTCLNSGLSQALADAAPAGRCLLSPMGSWRSIPLHLAAHLDLGDDTALPLISYTASGTTTGGIPDPTTFRERPAVILTDLTHSSTPLPWAVAEERLAVNALGPHTTVLSGPDTDNDTLGGYLRRNPDCAVIHITMHGSTRTESSRRRTTTNPATDATPRHGVDNNQNFATPALCLLLACVSGGNSDAYLDEVVRLQGAALVAEIGDVILTQWPAGDLATTLFAARLYEELLDGGHLCWEATHRVREWLRRVTDTEVVDYLKGKGVEIPVDLATGPGNTFADVWAWGSFVHYQTW